MKIKAALFDLDGTLLNSLYIWKKVDETFLNARGIEVPDDYQECVSALTYMETAVYTIKRFNLSDTPEGLMAEWNSLAQVEYRDNVELMPYARECLLRLKEEGVRLAIATTSPSFLHRPCLERLGIWELFEVAYTPDNIKTAKHRPEFYRRCAKNLGLAPIECMVIDDVPAVINSASAAGLCTVFMLGKDDTVNDRVREISLCAENLLAVPGLFEQ